MNVNVSISVFAAPGLSTARQQSVSAAVALFRGKTIPITNINDRVPINTLNFVQAMSLVLSIPMNVADNLIFLRALLNGQELDNMKSFQENNVSNNNLLNLHFIAK